jgi:hypothetical protein
MKDLRKRRGGNGEVLVVPLANLVEDFDSQTVLPEVVQQLVRENIHGSTRKIFLQVLQKNLNSTQHFYKRLTKQAFLTSCEKA